MTTNIETNTKGKGQAYMGESGEVKTMGQFTFVQALGLIILTIAVSIGGWYVVGKNYFWTGLDMKRVNQQLAYLQQQVTSNPKDPDLRISLGYTYFLKGQNNKAIAEYNQALALKKEFYDAFYNLGLVFEDENRYDDALEMFQKCTKLAPRDPKAYVQKGIIYRKMKLFKEAAESLAKANSIMPGSADIIYQIGVVAEEKGEINSAKEIYKDALSYDPLYKDAQEALERLQNK